jgi:hypothetical protein
MPHKLRHRPIGDIISPGAGLGVAVAGESLSSTGGGANNVQIRNAVDSQWERGEKRPGGAALKLLTLVEKNGLMAVA